MNRKKVWRYYCDFCKKSGCSADSIKKHESTCIGNPERVCGYCKAAGIKQRPLQELLISLGDGECLDEIRELSGSCPLCILSAIKQSGLIFYDEDGLQCRDHFDFNFMEEKKAFLEKLNEKSWCDSEKP